MTAVQAVSAFLPSGRVPVGGLLASYGVSDSQIRLHERFFGFSEICLDPAGSLTDQLVGAISGLEALRGQEHRVRYVLHARSMPVVAPHPANPLRDACAKLNLLHANAFSVSQHACASTLLALELAGRLLTDDADPDALALIVAADKAFTASAQVISNTGVMGEGAAALLVAPDGERDRVLGYATRTCGRFSDGPWMSSRLATEFKDVYPQVLAEVIRDAVSAAGAGIGDIALILPHNVNRMSWMRVLRLLGIRGTDRLFLANLGALGHCFAADSFINYVSAREQGLLRAGDRYLMTAVGLGATFSAMVLAH